MIEIILITYNRINSLRNTINSIKASELSSLKITVLDNCSTDGTSEFLCETVWAGELNLKHIRHTVNIGSSANTMFAYEIATSKYIWIICDDDKYDFFQFNEVHKVIIKYNPDILVVGSPINSTPANLFNDFNDKLVQASDLSKSILPLLLTFLPSAIINVQKLKSCDYRKGYDLAYTYFPQYFWISKLFEENWKIYILNKFLIIRPDTGLNNESDFIHMNGYLGAVVSITNKSVRLSAKNLYLGKSYPLYTLSIMKTLLKDRLLERLTWKNYFEHLKCIEGLRVLFFLIASLVLLFPNFLIAILFFKRRKKWLIDSSK